MTAPDPRSPVVVGSGQLRANRDRTVEGAREPFALLLEALSLASEDAGRPDAAARADAVYAVHVASWAYDALAARVAAAVGADARTCEDSGLGGQGPVRLLDRAAARIWAGDSDVALVVGAEAQASVSMLGKAGVDPVAELRWSADPGGPPAFDVDQLGSAAMQQAGLLAPTRVYPLYENRLQADLGLTPQEAHAWSSELYAAYSRVAAQQPASWSTEALDAAQVGAVHAGNRMVCEPYPLSMNAMPHVDQAAALVLTSYGTAREWGLRDDQLVHVWGGAGTEDAPDVLARPSLSAAPGLGQALDRCLAQAGASADELDLVDVYSCFPVVPKLVGLHLGLPRDHVLSVTGGHSSFGGPLNSYSLHALATVAQRLRAEPGTGLVHANGGYLTSQHAVLLSSRPHAQGYVGDPEPRAVSAADAVTTVLVGELPGEVDVVVETATVEHGRDGAPRQAFVVGRLADGRRVAAATPQGDSAAAAVLSLASLPAGATTHVGRRLRLAPLPDGTCHLTPAPPPTEEQQ